MMHYIGDPLLLAVEAREDKLQFCKFYHPFGIKYPNNNEKLRSFKSKESIHKKEVGPYRGIED